MASSRRLAAIMFTDVVGFSAMMSKDEKKALKVLQSNKTNHEQLLEQFQGELLKEMGDGMLLSFDNVTDGIAFASAIHHQTNKSNFQLRIGMHVGEVLFQDGDVFGEGVNIASRLETLAKPGETYVSEDVYHNIQNKPGIYTEFCGEFELKNVAGSWKVYKTYVDESSGIQQHHVSTQLVTDKREKRRPIKAFIQWMAIGFIGIAAGVGLWMNLGTQDHVEGFQPEEVRKLRQMKVAVLPFEGPTTGRMAEFGAMAPYWIGRRLKEVTEGKVLDVGDMTRHEEIPADVIERTGLEAVIQGRYFLTETPDLQLDLYVDVIYLATQEKREIGYFSGTPDEASEVLNFATQKILAIWALSDKKRWGHDPPRYDAFKKYEEATELWFDDYDGAFALLNEAYDLDSTFYEAMLKKVVGYNNLGLNVKSDSLLQILSTHVAQMDHWSQLRYKSLKARRDVDDEERNRINVQMVDFDPNDLLSISNTIRTSNIVRKPKQALEYWEKFEKGGDPNSSYCGNPAANKIRAHYLLEDYNAIQLTMDKAEKLPCSSYHSVLLGYYLRSLVRLDKMEVIDSLLPIYIEREFLGIEKREEKEISVYWNVIHELWLMGKDEIIKDFARKYISDLALIQDLLITPALIGEYEMAMDVADSSYRNDTLNGSYWASVMANFSIWSGDTTQAELWLDKMEHEPSYFGRAGWHYDIATIYACMNRKAEAMDHLIKAYEGGFGMDYGFYIEDCFLRNLLDYPPFQEFVKPRE